MSGVMRFNLQKAGFEVEVAENGRIAAEWLMAEPFDLLLTDFQMPEMDGDELCRRLRECPLNDEIPIIMVSAKGFELDIPSGSESLGGWCAVPPSLPPLGYELWEPEEGGSPSPPYEPPLTGWFGPLTLRLSLHPLRPASKPRPFEP